MENILKFRKFLTTVKKSSKTSKPFSNKVTSDIIGRCKLVEKALLIELSQHTLGTPDASKQICQEIKRKRISSTEVRPYAHNDLIYAVRIYDEFLAWRKANYVLADSHNSF